MSRMILVTLLSLGWFHSAALAGAVPDVTVATLDKWIKSKKVVVLDANGEGTRKKHGIIPNAVLLSSYDEYNIAKELPKDKNTQLVFYCANTKCTAAPKAAQRAMKAGYKNVSHLSVGIMGWKKAGKKVGQI